jgi:hypothetical protein
MIRRGASVAELVDAADSKSDFFHPEIQKTLLYQHV